MKKPGLMLIVFALTAFLLSGCYYAPPTSRVVHTYSTSTQSVQTSTYYGEGYPYRY